MTLQIQPPCRNGYKEDCGEMQVQFPCYAGGGRRHGRPLAVYCHHSGLSGAAEGARLWGE